MVISPPAKIQARCGFFLWLICSSLCSSCGSKPGDGTPEDTEEVIHTLVVSKIGLPTYRRILTMANDSIRTWRANHLKPWYGDTTQAEAQLDSVICINSTGNKLIMVNLLRELGRGKLDGIGYFYGVKIGERWYFFGGPTQFVYRKDVDDLTIFRDLHQFAINHIFRAYLHKDASGQWQINDHFFADLTSPAACPYGYSCQTPQDWDKAYLYWVAQNWQQQQRPE